VKASKQAQKEREREAKVKTLIMGNHAVALRRSRLESEMLCTKQREMERGRKENAKKEQANITQKMQTDATAIRQERLYNLHHRRLVQESADKEGVRKIREGSTKRAALAKKKQEALRIYLVQQDAAATPKTKQRNLVNNYRIRVADDAPVRLVRRAMKKERQFLVGDLVRLRGLTSGEWAPSAVIDLDPYIH
jgi:hypothetical protein